MGGGSSTNKKIKLPQDISVRFINFKAFKTCSSFPLHNGDSESEIVDKIDTENAIVIYISHMWIILGGSGLVYPDNEHNDVFKLCVEGIERLLQTSCAHISQDEIPCYVWIDYGCVNQQDNPSGAMTQLAKIMKYCDCMFTPLLDEQCDEWILQPSPAGYFHDYRASSWCSKSRSYVNRAWCRLEMMYCGGIPLSESTIKKKERFQLPVQFCILNGHRPHFIYGTKESRGAKRPLLLPRLTLSFYLDFPPEKGELSAVPDEIDKIIIRQLANQMRPSVMRSLKKGYTGQSDGHGIPEGRGCMVYDSGGVYTGEWKAGVRHGNALDNLYTDGNGTMYRGQFADNKMHGIGTCCYFNGDVYEGEWQNSRPHGKHCKFTFANGDVFSGEMEEGEFIGYGSLKSANGDEYKGNFKRGLKHGHGEFKYSPGNSDFVSYVGQYENNVRSGLGKLILRSGESYEGEFLEDLRHGFGKFSTIDGTLIEGDWKDDFPTDEARFKCIYTNGDIYEVSCLFKPLIK
jgi:hypothetical protein